MEATQVIEKILADAQAQADKIKADSAEKQAQKQAKFDDELAEYKKQTDTLCEKNADDKKSHILAAARMEIAKDLLAEKRRILDEVFVEAKKQMHQLSDEDYLRIMTKLMTEAVETGDEEVVVDKNETRIDHEFIKQINRQLGTGYKGNLRLANEKANIGGGFILRRGRIKTNVSFDVMLEQSRKELEIELAGILFS